jgi:hypothetical protein
MCLALALVSLQYRASDRLRAKAWLVLNALQLIDLGSYSLSSKYCVNILLGVKVFGRELPEPISPFRLLDIVILVHQLSHLCELVIVRNLQKISAILVWLENTPEEIWRLFLVRKRQAGAGRQVSAVHFFALPASQVYQL